MYQDAEEFFGTAVVLWLQTNEISQKEPGSIIVANLSIVISMDVKKFHIECLIICLLLICSSPLKKTCLLKASVLALCGDTPH